MEIFFYFLPRVSNRMNYSEMYVVRCKQRETNQCKKIVESIDLIIPEWSRSFVRQKRDDINFHAAARGKRVEWARNTDKSSAGRKKGGCARCAGKKRETIRAVSLPP